MNLKIGSLFSGIGGLELGLEWSGIGETVWQVEQCPKLRNCLAYHWPDAERFDDVRTVGKRNLAPVDLICGGFPCQGISSAGKGLGLSDSRSGLWSEFSRIIEDMHPRWVVVENVSSGATRWVDAVRRELSQLSYVSLPIPLSAADCGAWHRRSRIFIIAYSVRHGRGCIDGSSGKQQRRDIIKAAPGAASDPNSEWELQPQRRKPDIGRWSCNIGRVWAAEPNVVRMVHGIPARVDRERALGNSVVPQCAQVVGEVIKLLAA